MKWYELDNKGIAKVMVLALVVAIGYTWLVMSSVKNLDITTPVESTSAPVQIEGSLPVQRGYNHWQGELIQHSAPNQLIRLQYGERNR